MRLILASASPRRAELLRNAGFAVEVVPSGIEEAPRPGESAEAFAQRAAQEKALCVAASALASSLVLGADTVVAIDNDLLGKPADSEGAARMLQRLSGRTHRVITGICVVRPPDRLEATEHETTLVTFRTLDDTEICSYIASGEPFDKAGAYAIQGLASKFVTRIEGCYFNVVGLPIPRLDRLLKRFSPEPP